MLFEAWIHGPVIPALYNDYKQFSWKPIVRDDLTEGAYEKLKQAFSIEVQELLNDIIEEYFTMDAFSLERSTHLEDPWMIARKGFASDDPCNHIITKQSMIDFYSPHVKNVQ